MKREHDPGNAATGGSPQTSDDFELARRETRRRVVQFGSLLALVVVLVAFVVENSQRVEIHFVFFTKDVRPIWLMLTCAILGGVVGYLLGKPGKQVGRPGKHENKRKGSPKQP